MSYNTLFRKKKLFFRKWEKGYHRPNRQQNSQGIALDTEKAGVMCTRNHHPAPHNHTSSALVTWTWRGEQCYRTRRRASSQRPETLRKNEKRKRKKNITVIISSIRIVNRTGVDCESNRYPYDPILNHEISLAS